MRITHESDNCIVIDDLLSDDLFKSIQEKLVKADMEQWKFQGFGGYAAAPNDGVSFRHKMAQYSCPLGRPAENDLEIFQEIVNVQIMVAFQGKIKKVNSSFWVYPVDTMLCLHDDSHCDGSFAFYLHNSWSPTWGGQLIFTGEDGIGESIEPRPNRLVIVKHAKAHFVNRVDKNAGDRVRLSVAGFLHADAVTDAQAK